MNTSMNGALMATSRASSRFVPKRRDEGHDDDEPGIRHEVRYLGDPADVLNAVGFGEAQVAIEAMADVVANREDAKLRKAEKFPPVRAGSDCGRLAANRVAAYKKAYGSRPGFMAVSGYDGNQLIYAALKKTGGKTDGDALVEAIRG